MKHIHKTALVFYKTQEMFELVSNVTEYPKFLPWCKGVTILSQTPHTVVATLMMGVGGLEKSFTTKNVIKPNEWIEMRLVEGPFSHLYGHWHFLTLGDTGCKISLTLEFAVSNPFLRATLEPIFTKIANTLVDAFIKRANELYGKSN